MARILVAEDDPTYGRLLSRLLAEAGHVVEVATNGEDALARLREEPPELLLLDAIIPRLDGFGVVRAAKSDPVTALVPIIFIAGATDTYHKVRGLELGANDYITKPFRREELIARVNVALRIRQLEEDLRRKNDELAAQARTDALTGLANRRLFDERLAEEVERVRRYGHPLSVLMIDLDHFKGINDAIMHTGGDQVLRAVGTCLRSQMRPNDTVARMGGEEFAVLCSETDLPGALAMAERICGAISQLHSEKRSPLPLTTSVGVATLPEGSTFTGDMLLEAADAALYEAKRAGRNRVRSLGRLTAPLDPARLRPRRDATDDIAAREDRH